MEQPLRLIDADQVAHRLRISKRTLYRQLRLDRIPHPVERRRGVVAKWRASDVDSFIANMPTVPADAMQGTP